MNLLVDTHLLVWAAAASDRLPTKARARLSDAVTTPWFSVVSLWEVVIKSGLRREDFKVDAARLREGLLSNGWNELEVQGDHVLAVSHLPRIHRDPFDRLLIAQATREQFPLLTADARLDGYGTMIELV